MKIILCNSKTAAERFAAENVVSASVEAEYGDFTLCGQEVTLAHHGVNRGNICPCLNEFKLRNEDEAIILVSHIDMDTIGGVLSLVGGKPEICKDFWNMVAFVDLNGPHKLQLMYSESDVFEKQAIEVLWACFKHIEENIPRFTGKDLIVDVTQVFMDMQRFLIDVSQNPDKYAEEGRNWNQKKQYEIDQYLVSENQYLRVFSAPMFANGAYYSKVLKRLVPAVVNLNTAVGSITLSFEDGGEKYNAAAIMKEHFGPEAGGHAGIAGSPRGIIYTMDDLLKFRDHLMNIMK